MDWITYVRQKLSSSLKLIISFSYQCLTKGQKFIVLMKLNLSVFFFNGLKNVQWMLRNTYENNQWWQMALCYVLSIESSTSFAYNNLRTSHFKISLLTNRIFKASELWEQCSQKIIFNCVRSKSHAEHLRYFRCLALD